MITFINLKKGKGNIMQYVIMYKFVYAFKNFGPLSTLQPVLHLLNTICLIRLT